MRRTTFVTLGLTVVLMAGTALALTIPNWTAPPTWTPTKGLTASAMSSDLSNPVPFVPVTPCRVADTRTGSGFSGQYGPPSLSSGGNRSFTITGQCGIPSGAAAVSFNFTILDMTTGGDIRVYPAGGAVPLVSTQNWVGTTGAIANAAVVTLGSGGITVYLDGLGSVDLIIDVNGYYAAYINSSEYFGIVGNQLGGVIYGQNNTTSVGYGVRGQVPSGGAGAAGTLGEYLGSAAGYGVEGSSVSATNAVGVIGRDRSGTVTPFGSHAYIPNGVRGESASGIGVFGLSNYMAGGFENYTSGDSMQSLAYLGMATYAVSGLATSTSDGTAGVIGQASGSSGATYGVQGVVSSTASDAAGVQGNAGSPNLGTMHFVRAGVRGEGAASTFGVLGISHNIAGGFYHLNASTGAFETDAWLASSSTTAISGTGNFSVTGTKSFVEPHPTDPTKVIKYVSLEGPEAGTYFRGKGRITGGQAIIQVPETFRMVTDEDGLSVQVTPIGRSVAVSVASYDLNEIVVEGARDVEFFYLVQGVRKAFKDFQPIQDNEEYKPMTPKDTMPTALSAEQKRILVKTGIFNEDGTVNLNTAERLGWAQQWRDRDAQLKVAAEATAAKQGEAVRAGQSQNEKQP